MFKTYSKSLTGPVINKVIKTQDFRKKGLLRVQQLQFDWTRLSFALLYLTRPSMDLPKAAETVAEDCVVNSFLSSFWVEDFLV